MDLVNITLIAGMAAVFRTVRTLDPRAGISVHVAWGNHLRFFDLVVHQVHDAHPPNAVPP